MLPLVAGKNDWRPYLDLEHGVCYSPRNHWNALTDGRQKYIYHAFDGAEEFFDLERDPNEMTDLTATTSAAPLVAEWRRRMVAHLEPRGDQWVRNGVLVPRPQNMPRSPNFPGENR
jgi:hypothetical protein